MTEPLKGLKVLDFSTLLPGPCATMMLADMGAEVLRIESPTRVDLLRVLPPMQGKVSASHAYLNRSKRSLALDLKKEGARDIVLRLLEDYDIVVEQFRPGVMARFGLGYDDLRSRFPGLIYCSITGYGQTGPYRDRAGHDINYLARAGISSYSGRKATGPGPVGVQIADVAGGSHHAVMGILAAVIQRQSTGEGTHVDVSMSDAALALNHMSMASHLATGQDPELESEVLNGAGSYDYFETQDGRYLSVGALEPQFLQALCIALDVPQMASRMLSQKPEDRQSVKATLAELFKQKSLSDWEAIFSEIDACVEPVRTLSETTQDVHFQARNMFVDCHDASGNSYRQLASPLVFSGERSTPRFPGAGLGAHNREILSELGYDPEQVATLEQNGVFGKTRVS